MKMKTAFLRFSWGIVWVLLDFRFNNFDMLPDIIGYALIWNAISKLGEYRRGYLAGRPFAIMLLLLSLQEIFPVLGHPSAKLGSSIPMLAYGSLMMLLMLIMVSTFLLEMSRHAVEANANEWARILKGRRWLYIVIGASTLLYVPFTINGLASFTTPATILTSILGILAQLILLFTCRRAAQELLEPST